MSVKQRLKEFILYKEMSDRQFSLSLGVSGGYVNSISKSIQPDKVNSISIQYPELNTAWLMTGEGEMLKGSLSTIEPVAQYEVLLLPISAQGGSLSNFAESVSAEQCERIISPIKDVSFAMSVTGDSMEPEYPSGSKILIKKINERAFIEWGRCYVLDTCNGTVVKKLMPSDDPEKLKCVSTNTEYPPFEVYLTDIFGVYRVLMMLAEK